MESEREKRGRRPGKLVMNLCRAIYCHFYLHGNRFLFGSFPKTGQQKRRKMGMYLMMNLHRVAISFQSSFFFLIGRLFICSQRYTRSLFPFRYSSSLQSISVILFNLRRLYLLDIRNYSINHRCNAFYSLAEYSCCCHRLPRCLLYRCTKRYYGSTNSDGTKRDGNFGNGNSY